jgi:uncharacterized membrane protein
MNFLWRILCAAITVGIAYLLWPVLKWLAVVVFILGFVLVLYLAIASRKVKAEIDKDPNAYFEKQSMEQLKKKQAQGDVIEAEYTEREVPAEEKEETKE